MEITLPAVIVVRHWCFATTTSETFGRSCCVEKKNQVGHRGFATSAFDVTIAHPLQKKFIEIAMEEAGVAAEEAHDRKLLKSLEYARSLSSYARRKAFETVHETVRKWT